MASSFSSAAQEWDAHVAVVQTIVAETALRPYEEVTRTDNTSGTLLQVPFRNSIHVASLVKAIHNATGTDVQVFVGPATFTTYLPYHTHRRTAVHRFVRFGQLACVVVATYGIWITATVLHHRFTIGEP